MFASVFSRKSEPVCSFCEFGLGVGQFCMLS